MAPGPVYFDSHMHTPLCKHAEGRPEEYAEVGLERGLKGVIFTCHSPMPDGFSHAVRMEPSEFSRYVGMVRRAAEVMRGRIEVRLGMESDWFPGMEPWLAELHNREPFHFILGSVHYHIPEYLERFLGEDGPDAFERGYFRHLAEAAESSLFDCISHPDLVKNRRPRDWRFRRVEATVRESLDRIAETGVAMELNTSGVYKSVPEMNPGPEMLRLMRERSIPVVIGSDSHRPGRVGDDFDIAVDALEAAGYECASYFEERRRVDVPLAEIRESLAAAAGRSGAGKGKDFGVRPPPDLTVRGIRRRVR